ncbi:LysR substrate-binding domain-containing protein [Hamadaea tsunoensis]|uniref:LysR substrate-binding domain-containing protein n=1 Tax=Hamadaea tsunoensis TaxID=53368 RepID=UPI0004066F91|nr:LysR substrate-binding domain-containing protein [Hamadaea tsunoensis]
MPINPIHLRAFHAVAAEGSFVRAAARLGVSQPTLSEQVRTLEQTHQVLLFDRRGRRTELTAVGERLHEITRRMSDLAAEAERCLQDAAGLHVGQLHIAADSPGYAMPLLAALAEAYPGIRTSLSTGNAAKVLADLYAYRADVAYVCDVEPDPRLVSWPLFHTSVVAVVGAGHAWSGRTTIDAADLVRCRLVTREPGSITRKVFRRELQRAGLTATDVLEVDSREAVMAAARVGVGVGLVAEDELPEDSSLTRLRIEPFDLTITEYLACLVERREFTVIRTACDLALRIA